MKARFISSDPTETDTVYAGIEFPVNGPFVAVPAELGARLATSPCFEVEDGEEIEASDDGLGGMTVPELREMAEGLAVDLADAKKKADIIAAIRAKLADA